MTPLLKKWISALAVVAALTASASGVIAGGGGYGGYGGGGGQRIGGGRGFNIRQVILGREQANVIIPDEEWAVVEPKLWKVVTLQAIAGPDQPNFAATAVRRIITQNPTIVDMDPDVAALSTEILQRENELMAALDEPNGGDTQVEIKLRDYRATRDRVRAALKAAEASLQNILTLRQESVLLEDGFMQ